MDSLCSHPIKSWRRRLFACAVLLLASTLKGEQFPPTGGQNLLGKPVFLPAAAAGQPAILVLGFTHASQNQTKAWSQRLEKQFPPPAPVWIYSIAVLQDVPKLVRGMAVHGIKSGVPAEQHARFLLVYRKEEELKQAAGFTAPDDAYIVVLDPAGAIRWRFHGPVTDSAIDQLLAQLK